MTASYPPKSDVESRFETELNRLRVAADHSFLILMLLQWGFAVACAVCISPRTWHGPHSETHPHVWIAVFLGGLLISLPSWLIVSKRHSWITRWSVAVAQAGMSSLLIHLMAGRIEAHFHIFGILAFLSFYRDKAVYLPAVTLIALDHIVRGVFWPESVFGVMSPSVLRALEHAAWVLFETFFLCVGINHGHKQVAANCRLQIDLEQERDQLEVRVEQRTEELAQSHTFLSTVLNGLDAEICIVDAQGDIIRTNESWDNFARNNGGRPIIQGNYLSVCRSATGECARSAAELADGIERVLSGAAPSYSSEYACRSPEQERWFQVSVSPLRLASGMGAAICHVCITARVIAENEVREQSKKAERLALVAKHTDSAVVITDAGGRIEWVNDGFVRMSGYTPAEAYGRKPGEFLHGPQTDQQTVQLMRDGINSAAGFDVEIINYHKSGRPYWISIEVRPILGPDGEVENFIAIESDITERRNQAEALRSLNSKLTEQFERLHEEKLARERLLTESAELAKIIRESPQELYIFERDSLRFVEVNAGACASTGYARDELLAMTPIDLKPAFDHAAFREMIEPLAGGQTASLDFSTEHQRKNGDTYPTTISLHAATYGSKEVYVAFVTDITELQQLQNRLNQAQKLESLGQLSAGLAHEINTPMQFIGDNIEYLSDSSERLFNVIDRFEEVLHEDQPFDWQERRDEMLQICVANRFEHIRAELPGAIEDCRDGVRRTVNIVKAMKTFSHPGEQEATPTCLNEAVESTVAVSRNKWKYSATLDLDLDPDLPTAEVFAAEINQSLLNLIVNAADAVSDRHGDRGSGRIHIRTRHTEDVVVVEVEDNGGGVPESIRDRVFDPFFTTKQVGKGTGQGLALVHNIVVTMHGGRLHLANKPGEGALFRIELPIQTSSKSDRRVNDTPQGETMTLR